MEFFDLDAMSDVNSVQPGFEGLVFGDYFSAPIFVDSGIPIGARGTLTTQLYVSGHWN